SLRSDVEQANEHYLKAYALNAALVQDAAPGDRTRCDLADVCLRLGNTNINHGDHEATSRYLCEAEALLQNYLLNAPQHHDVFGRLAVRPARWGDLLLEGGNLAAAYEEFDLARAEFEKVVAVSPNQYRRDLATAYGRMGKIDFFEKKFDAARGHFAKS